MLHSCDPLPHRRQLAAISGSSGRTPWYTYATSVPPGTASSSHEVRPYMSPSAYRRSIRSFGVTSSTSTIQLRVGPPGRLATMRNRSPGRSTVPASGSIGSTRTTTHHRVHSARSTSAPHTSSTDAGTTTSVRQRYSGDSMASFGASFGGSLTDANGNASRHPEAPEGVVIGERGGNAGDVDEHDGARAHPRDRPEE